MIKTYNHLHYSYANYKVEFLYLTETKQKQNKGATATTKNLTIKNEIVTKDSAPTITADTGDDENVVFSIQQLLYP